MPSHFSTIGFPIKSKDDFYQLANRLARESKVIPVHGGAYLRWSSESGVEIWLQVDNSRDLIGMVPHFTGKARLNAGITARVTRPDKSALDGAFQTSADPDDDNPRTGLYDFVFDTPDFCRHAELTLLALAPVQIAAFAHQIDVHESVEDYDDANAGKAKMASQSFIPSGLFAPDGSRTEPPRASGILAGHIVEAAKKHNEMSGRNFYWALVESYGGSFDVVIDPELIDAEPKTGGVVFGSFWLSGRLI